MIIKTKKYQLDSKKYINLAFSNSIKEFWWAFGVPIAMLGLCYFSFWWALVAVLVTVLYVAFWYAQFYGVTKLPQFKQLFDKMFYQIDSRQMARMLNDKQGMPVQWDQIKFVKKDKDGVALFLNRAHLIYLPYKIFNSDNEIKFFEMILKRKGLLQEEVATAN